MGMRAFVVGLLLLLQEGCCYGYMVGRECLGVDNLDPQSLVKAVKTYEWVTYVHPWDGKQLMVHCKRGDAVATLVYALEQGSAYLGTGSDWWNHVPEYEALCASIALQDDLIGSLSATVPGFPPSLGLGLAWGGLENPLGPRFGELKARYEAEHGK